MNFLNSTSLVVLIYSLSILGIIIVPLAASLILQLYGRLFKFSKNDFKTALCSNLIVFGIFFGVYISLGILFLDQIQKLSSIFSLLSSIIALIAGAFIVRKFHGSSLVKSFFALFLTGITLFIGLVFVIILVSLGISLMK